MNSIEKFNVVLNFTTHGRYVQVNGVEELDEKNLI